MIYLWTSNKNHILMEAEEELSLLFPKQRKVIVFPVSVPVIVQKIFEVSWFEIFSNGSFL